MQIRQAIKTKKRKNRRWCSLQKTTVDHGQRQAGRQAEIDCDDHGALSRLFSWGSPVDLFTPLLTSAMARYTCAFSRQEIWITVKPRSNAFYPQRNLSKTILLKRMSCKNRKKTFFLLKHKTVSMVDSQYSLNHIYIFYCTQIIFWIYFFEDTWESQGLLSNVLATARHFMA